MITKRTQDNLNMIRKYIDLSPRYVEIGARKQIINECVADIEQELKLNGVDEG